MTIDQLGSIGEVLGAFATVVMLVFLSIQIRDNTIISKTSTLASMLEGARDRTAGILSLNGEVSDIVTRVSIPTRNWTRRKKFGFVFCYGAGASHAKCTGTLPGKVVTRS